MNACGLANKEMSGFSAFNKTVKFQVKLSAEFLPAAKIVLINIFQTSFKNTSKKG